MKRLLPVIMLLTILPLLTAMGDTPPGKVPRTDRNYAATFVDLGGVKTDCTEVSIDGNTFLDGNRGGGKLAISFDKIRGVLFRMKDGSLLADVTLMDGSLTVITVDKKRKAYGRSQYGVFQIGLPDMKQMIFHPAQGHDKKG